jgi:hypothetical protein
MKSEDLIDFLERNLGAMSNGLLFESPPERPVQVARFENQPVPNAVTYVTTGVSKHVLHQLSGREIRMELLTCLWSRFDGSALGTLLHVLAQEILDRHHAPAHGEVTEPRGPIVPGSKLEAFYFMPPLYHAEDIELWHGPADPETVIVWAVPIALSEAQFIANAGWPSFEERMREVDPDFLDLDREPFV